jgi:hypothetical protein
MINNKGFTPCDASVVSHIIGTQDTMRFIKHEQINKTLSQCFFVWMTIMDVDTPQIIEKRPAINRREK